MAEDGFLDAHLPLLHVGDAQSMVFKPTNIGPWYLLPAQKEVQRRDRVTGKSKLLEKSKKQLLEQLKEVGVTLQQQRGYTKKELQTFAQNNGIELCERKEQIMAGWEGQSKGLLQVLCKRAGLTKIKMLDKYTLNGQRIQSQGKLTYCIHFGTCLLNVVQGLSMRKRYYNSTWEQLRCDSSTDAKIPC